MKKMFFCIVMALFSVNTFAQYYSTGTSTTGQTDYWGNTTTKHNSTNTNNVVWTY